MARPVTSEPSHLRRLRVLAQHIAPDEAHEVLYGAPASVSIFFLWITAAVWWPVVLRGP